MTPATALPSLADEIDALHRGRDDLRLDPYPLLARLRDEAPIYEFEPLDIVLVSSYEGIKFVIDNPDLFIAETRNGRYARAKMERFSGVDQRMLTDLQEWLWAWFIEMDGPAHRRIRGLAHNAFTRTNVLKLEGRIEEIVDELLAPGAARGTLELVSELALPLPQIIICDMLGIPLEARDQISSWSHDLEEFIGGDHFDVARSHAALVGFRDYLLEVISREREQPSSALLGSLMRTDTEDALSDHELWATMTFMLFAGHETTTNLIGNCLKALMGHREQWERVCEEPRLVPAAVEEILRYDSSVLQAKRMATEDVTVEGTVIRAGDTVRLLYGGANRDPRAFDDPDRFDVERPRGRGHFGFGRGAHHCLGSQLSRLELAVVLRTIAARFPDVTLTGDIEMGPAVFLRGPRRMQLDLGRDRGPRDAR